MAERVYGESVEEPDTLRWDGRRVRRYVCRPGNTIQIRKMPSYECIPPRASPPASIMGDWEIRPKPREQGDLDRQIVSVDKNGLENLRRVMSFALSLQVTVRRVGATDKELYGLGILGTYGHHC